MTLDQQAQRLWDYQTNYVHPTWDQLGDATRSVWRERAGRGEQPDMPAYWRGRGVPAACIGLFCDEDDLGL